MLILREQNKNKTNKKSNSLLHFTNYMHLLHTLDVWILMETIFNFTIQINIQINTPKIICITLLLWCQIRTRSNVFLPMQIWMHKDQSELKEFKVKKSSLWINTLIDSNSLPFPQCPYATKGTKIGSNYSIQTSLS